MAEKIDSTDARRAEPNILGHEYRVLSDAEKALVKRIKDLGAEFVAEIENLETSRELSLARTKLEEAVMWAVKHVTR